MRNAHAPKRVGITTNGWVYWFTVNCHLLRRERERQRDINSIAKLKMNLALTKAKPNQYLDSHLFRAIDRLNLIGTETLTT